MTSADTAEKEANEALCSLLAESEELTNTTAAQGVTIVSNTLIPWQAPTATVEENQQFPQTTDKPQVTWNGYTMLVDQPEEIDDTIYDNNVTTETEIEADTNPKEEINSESKKQKETVSQVKERFERGCECQGETCFQGLSAESVHKHRTHIAEMSKKEHEIYLMGAMMACLNNPETTCNKKERRRLRSQYVYQGKQVCLDAYLYLENCTHYEVKRLRKHITTHGVTLRVHGNHGKKPNNILSLDVYKLAEEFVRKYLKIDSITPIQLPKNITYTNLHIAYRRWVIKADGKYMGCSKFKRFMKEQFPHVEFCKTKAGRAQMEEQTVLEETVITPEDVQPLVPMGYDNSAMQPTFLVAPAPQFLPNASCNSVPMQNITEHTKSGSAENCQTQIEEHQTVLEEPVTTPDDVQPLVPMGYDNCAVQTTFLVAPAPQFLTDASCNSVPMENITEHTKSGSVEDCQTQTEDQTVLEETVTAPEDVQQFVPMGYNNSAVQTTFFVAPAPQFLPNNSCNLVPMQNITDYSVNAALPYQIINTGYVVNEQGNVFTTFVPQPFYTYNQL